jgi:sugar phosphate isomerase/epimerase
MRFSFVVSAGLGYHIPDLFETEASFREFQSALKLLKRHGFSGVEVNLATTERTTLARIAKVIRAEELQLAAVGTGLLYLRRRYSFTDRNAARRRKAIASVNKLIEFASQHDAVVIIGMIRGGVSAGSRNMPLLSQALVECDTAASEHGVRLALEAINRYETSRLNTAAEVGNIIHEQKLRSTGMLLDSFHMNIEEAFIEGAIREFHEEISHFHIADSNRLAPGHGHSDIEQQLKLLEELGYRGWASAEVLPKPDNPSAVIDTALFLREKGFLSRS